MKLAILESLGIPEATLKGYVDALEAKGHMIEVQHVLCAT